MSRFSAPVYLCDFVVEPLSFENSESHPCDASARYKIEVHKHRQKAETTYSCKAHVGGLINVLNAQDQVRTDTLPRWVVTPLVGAP